MIPFLSENSTQMDNNQESLGIIHAVPGMATEARVPSGFPLLEGIPIVPQIAINSSYYLNLTPSYDMISEQTNFTQSCLKSILQSIDSDDEAVSTTWLETLIDVIHLLPEDVIKEKIFDMALKKSRSDNSKARRLIARLLGLVSSKINAGTLSNLVLNTTLHLCQDSLPSVRQAICRELPVISSSISSEDSKSLLLPLYITFCQADEVEVKSEAFSIFVEMIAFADDDYIMEIMLPIIKKAYDAEVKEPSLLLPTLARQMGKLCYSLQDKFSTTDMDYFMYMYRRMSTIGLQNEMEDLVMPDVLLCRWTGLHRECRRQCAYNLPAFVFLFGQGEAYEDHIYDIMTAFLNDPFADVRVPIAHSFHEICNLVGSKIYLLKEALIRLLECGVEEVVIGVTTNISDILDVFNFHGMISSELTDKFLNDLVQAIITADNCLCNTRNWRAQSEWLRQISALAVHLPITHLIEHIVPVLRKRMYEAKVLPCRLAAARSFVVCIKYLENTVYERHLCDILIEDFCDNNSFNKRMLFLRTCEMALQMISLSSFKEHLLSKSLSLYNDPVPNIRRILVELLPLIKCTFYLPEDKSKLETFNLILSSLSNNEMDRDVKKTISDMTHILDQIDIKGHDVDRKEIEETEDRNVSIANTTDSSSVNDSFKDVDESFNNGKPSLDDSIDKYQDAKETPDDEANYTVAALPLLGEPENRPILRPNNGRIPTYIASERRKSTTCAPEQPPNTAVIAREGGNQGELSLKTLCNELNRLEEAVSSWPKSTARRIETKLENSSNKINKDAKFLNRRVFPSRRDTEDRIVSRGSKEPINRKLSFDPTNHRKEFWLRSRRGRSVRKTASADTSPEAVRRPFILPLSEVTSTVKRFDCSDRDAFEEETYSCGGHTWPPHYLKHSKFSVDESDYFLGTQQAYSNSDREVQESFVRRRKTGHTVSHNSLGDRAYSIPARETPRRKYGMVAPFQSNKPPTSELFISEGNSSHLISSARRNVNYQNLNHDTLSLLMSAKPSSTFQANFDVSRLPETHKEHSYEDLYVAHGITPTIARKICVNGDSSEGHELMPKQNTDVWRNHRGAFPAKLHSSLDGDPFNVEYVPDGFRKVSYGSQNIRRSDDRGWKSQLSN